MATSLLSTFSIQTLIIASVFVVSSLSRDFSIVGYSPEHLSSTDKLIELFEEWISKHDKIYESIEEKLRRFEVFKDNLEHIDKRNKEINSYWLGLNEFADLSHDEFKNMYLGLKRPDVRRDNRSPKVVLGIFNGGGRRGQNQIVTGNLTSLSEQELIDCDTSFNNGCNGGLMDYAFQFTVANGGLHKEQDYPYLMEEGTCEEKKDEMEIVTISGYHDVPQNDEQSLLKALSRQPLSVAIEASGRDFQFYSGGVFNGPCGTELDHGVAAVGYGTSKGTDY
ncbi:Xylem cysteine proteinase 1 [Hibiscus syriacus]|uniref:Xylem cysteine proteinase 1 n=1 Tax=Hibiscus syriacus TaxID=106335 RepID=A0A6A2Z4B0_HIBSY|nr:Xylem cysteine proteinase 1 [Hibiscus syriacus]